MKTVKISDFKARCLAILEEVERTGQSLTILKRGKPIALVSRAQRDLSSAFTRRYSESQMEISSLPCRITPSVVTETTTLPADFHRDPADRIIVATARLEKATLMTCDRRIIESGVVPTL